MYLSILAVLGLLIVVLVLMVYFKITPLTLSIHKPFFQKSGIALECFDPVTFFTNASPQKGLSENILEWSGVSWFFVSPENALLFKNNPESYAPRYGGYCTKAIGTGFTGPSDVKYWTIYNNSLFLFSSEKALNEFLENPKKHIDSCNKKWKDKA